MSDRLTLEQAVAELERRMEKSREYRARLDGEDRYEVNGEITGLMVALDILRRVDTGEDTQWREEQEDSRLLDALEALCKRATTSGDGMLPETEQYYLCAGWRWSGSGAKACVHIDGEQQYEGDTLRAALRELAKEVADD